MISILHDILRVTVYMQQLAGVLDKSKPHERGIWYRFDVGGIFRIFLTPRRFVLGGAFIYFGFLGFSTRPASLLSLCGSTV